MKCVCELMQVHHNISIVSILLNVEVYCLHFYAFHSFKLKHFWRKLQLNQISFSACGIIRIDRGLLTSVDE